MTETESVHTQFPRKSIVVQRHRRLPISVLSFDQRTINVRKTSAGDAPVAVEMPIEGKPNLVWRMFDGAFYRPFDIDGSGEIPTENLSGAVAKRVKAQTKAGHFHNLPGEDVFGPTLADVVKPNAALGIRQVIDTGAAAQDALVAQLSNDLLSVDGVLYHRSPTPGFRIELNPHDSSASAKLTDASEHLIHPPLSQHRQDVRPARFYGPDDPATGADTVREEAKAKGGWGHATQRRFIIRDQSAIDAVLGPQWTRRDRTLFPALIKLATEVAPRTTRERLALIDTLERALANLTADPPIRPDLSAYEAFLGLIAIVQKDIVAMPENHPGRHAAADAVVAVFARWAPEAHAVLKIAGEAERRARGAEIIEEFEQENPGIRFG